jgi:DNA-binding NarL/FixJ family response regulator
MGDPTRVLIVDDHTLLAESLAMALRLRDFDEVEVRSGDLDGEAILADVNRLKPDVVLLDLFLGTFGPSIPLITPIHERGPKVLVLTASQDPVMLARCLEAGAAGVFDKAQPFDDLLTYVVDAALGHSTMRPAARDVLLAHLADHRRDTDALRASFARLTEREAAVLEAIVAGSNADEIAARLTVAVSTVRSHIRAIFDKLGVNSQLAAVALARRAGWPERGN